MSMFRHALLDWCWRKLVLATPTRSSNLRLVQRWWPTRLKGSPALSFGIEPNAFEHAHLSRTGRRARPVDALPSSLQRAVSARFEGDPEPPALRFDLRGLRPFATSVLQATLTIPRGEVRPYGWVARAIGNPAATRAVGTALGHNPIPLLIPCHRVIRADGHVGNYALGPERKRIVLRQEGLDPDLLERRADAGQGYHANATTGVYCYPTCSQTSLISDDQPVMFRTAQQATAAGFRPCQICRP